MLLMPVLTACTSQHKKEPIEIVPVIIGLDDVYFPAFPDPEDNIVPLDQDGNIVTFTDEHIVKVELPFWYWNMIIDYVEETENAVTALYAAHPP